MRLVSGTECRVPTAFVDEEFVRWSSAAYPEELFELEAMRRDPDAIQDAFGSELRFGTGGLRAIMGPGPNRLNVRTVARATQGVCAWLADGNDSCEEPKVLLARDTRNGGDELLKATAETLAGNGVKAVVLPGASPTPLLSFGVRELGCAAGVVLTASHNPREYNGYKVYGPDGCQITTADARSIQGEMAKVDVLSGARRLPWDDAVARGLIEGVPGRLSEHYLDELLSATPEVGCEDVRIAYSPLNGTGAWCVPAVLERLGATVRTVGEQMEPDGSFPTCPKPNPEEPSAMRLVVALAERSGCDVALATDPDADRVGVFVSHGGAMVPLSGNDIGVLLLDWLCSREVAAGRGLSERIAVTTIVSAPMADAVAKKWGIELRRTLTGFKFCGEQIGLLEGEGREGDFLLGLEESLGYLTGTYVRDKDGVQGCALVCEMVADYKRRGMTLVDALAALRAELGFYAGRQISLGFGGAGGQDRMADLMSRVRRDAPVAIGGLAVESVIDYADGAPMPIVNPGPRCAPQSLPPSNVLEWRLSGDCRVIVRPSGTEPKLKAYLFARGDNEAAAGTTLDAMEHDVRALLG